MTTAIAIAVGSQLVPPPGLSPINAPALSRHDLKVLLVAVLIGGVSYSASMAITQYRWRAIAAKKGLTLEDLALQVLPIGLVVSALVLSGIEVPRSAVVISFVSLAVAPSLPYLLPQVTRNTSAWVLAVTSLGILGVAIQGRVLMTEAGSAAAAELRTIKTEYYTLDERIYGSLVPAQPVKGGGLARIGEDLLLATGNGHVYLIKAEAGELKARQLGVSVPINGHEFAASASTPWTDTSVDATSREGGTEVERLHPEWFRVYSLLVQERDSRVRLFASHMYWYQERMCWVERVSMLDTERHELLSGGRDTEWQLLFESKPCLPATGPARRHGIPVTGYFGGGRLALLDDEHLLLAVGDFGFDGVASPMAVAQDPTSSYGKVLKIRISDGREENFTLGHRNPQGLYVEPGGVAWSTEHGPQGGDELNRLEHGGNYGWPNATFGTDYGSSDWPRAAHAVHEAYVAPIFSWVPSIGVSSLVRVENDLFSEWKGDLIISSLRAGSLFRARVVDGRVVYAEPIPLGCGIRDLVESKAGQLVLWSDQCGVIVVSPKAVQTGESLFGEYCGGCHQSGLASGNRMGPSLHRVLGRKAGSLGGYPDYSPCMRGLSLVWTKTALDNFLANPAGVCPGTTMELNGVRSDQERAAIIDYLGSLK